MTGSVLTPHISSCQFQKFIQAGLFPGDGNIVLLTKKEKENIHRKAWRYANREKINVRSNAWHKANIDRHKALQKAWNIKNPEKIKSYSTKHSSSTVSYDAYSDKLQKYGNISQDSDGTLLVVCVYCGKLYAPNVLCVKSRIQSINVLVKGECNFYCSNLCKVACPTFNQKIRYKFQPIGHTREVPAEFRHMALFDRNYTCENCGSIENGLHVHHIHGYTESPMEMADLPNIKVLCSACHKAVHSVPGCLYVDYSCKHQI